MKHVSFLTLFILLFQANSLAQAAQKPRIQLAKPYQETEKISEYFVSEKLDGIRGYWTGSKLITRSGHTISTPKFFTENWPNVPLDGEIWLARQRFEKTSSFVRKQTPIETEWRQLSFMVFDLPTHQGTFKERVKAMHLLANKTENPYLKIVKQHQFNDHSSLMAHFEQVVSNGGEGLMLHYQHAQYHIGRTANIMKLKPFDDADAIVIEHLPGKGKYQGMLGAIRVRTEGGITFKIGSGFSDKDRQFPPPLGSIVTFKYSGKTQQGVPRFASFLRVRQLSKVK